MKIMFHQCQLTRREFRTHVIIFRYILGRTGPTHKVLFLFVVHLGAEALLNE